MSADNGIYILVTKDDFKKIGRTSWENQFSKGGIIAYRVAHAQGISNLEWYEENQPYNTGKFLSDIFGNSPVFYDIKEANQYAFELEKKYDFLEYGINTIHRDKYCFPS